MMFQIKLGCDYPCAFAEFSMDIDVLQALDYGAREAVGGRRIARRQAAIHPIDQPVAYPPTSNAATGIPRKPASGPTRPKGSGHKLGTTNRSVCEFPEKFLGGFAGIPPHAFKAAPDAFYRLYPVFGFSSSS